MTLLDTEDATRTEGRRAAATVGKVAAPVTIDENIDVCTSCNDAHNDK